MEQSKVVKDASGRVYNIYGTSKEDVEAHKKKVKAVDYEPEGVEMFKSQKSSAELDAIAAENQDLKERLEALEKSLQKSTALKEAQNKEQAEKDAEEKKKLEEAKKAGTANK